MKQSAEQNSIGCTTKKVIRGEYMSTRPQMPKAKPKKQ